MVLQTIHVYHTNDLHSHFENWPKIAQYLLERKSFHKKNKEDVILLDIGDHIDRFHPLTEATKGKANVELLNQLQYNAVTIGNNEGITLAFEDLDHLYDHAQFPVIVSNLFYSNGSRPKWIKPYHILTCSNNIKIGLIGATVYYEKFYELLGWKITNPYESLKEVLNELRGKVDIVIFLSHLGLSDDEWVAKKFPEIDIILGGHTHHVLPEGKKIQNTLLAGAGKYGQWIGHVTLTIDEDNKVLENVEAKLIQTNTIKMENENISKWIKVKQNQAKEKLNETVVVLKQALKVDWFSESPLAKLLASAIHEWCNGELAMVNAGVLLESLPEGKVTKEDIHRICPHPINPCKVLLKGDQLKEVILQARTQKMEELQLKGLGFRGKVMGRMVFSGAEVISKKLSDGKEHVQEIYINGEPLDPNRIYSVATIDMFTLGPLYPEISHASKKEYFMPEMLRDVLEWKLKQLT